MLIQITFLFKIINRLATLKQSKDIENTDPLPFPSNP